MKRNSKNRMIAPTLTMMLFALFFAATPVSADTGAAGAPTLAMMGGGMGGGGPMMGGQGNGSGGWGGHMGDGSGWFSGRDRFRGGDGIGNTYRGDDRRALRQELRQERRELSDMLRSGNADPGEVDRKMDRIEALERQFDGLR